MSTIEKLIHKINDAVCWLTNNLIGVENDSFGIHIGEPAGIADGFKDRIVVPFDCVITGWELLEVSETPLISNLLITIDYSTYNDYPSDTTSDIQGTSYPDLVDSVKNKSSDVTAWSKIALTKGDVLNIFISDSDGEAAKVKFVLHVRKV